MAEIFFSILIPTFNRREWLINALKSVIEQSFLSWECLVIDDGSTDNTHEVICKFSDERISYYFQEKKERSAARNLGIENAKGKFICFLDSDDYYLPNHLSILHEFIEKNNFRSGLYYTGTLNKVNGKLINGAILNDACMNPILFAWYNFLFINSICVHREILLSERFPEKYSSWEDMHLWLRILLKYPFFQINNYTTVTVTHSNNSHHAITYDLDKLQEHNACVNDLFASHGGVLSKFITKEMIINYLTPYYKMVVVNAWRRRNYLLAVQSFYSLAKFTHFNVRLLVGSIFKFTKISFK